MCIISPRRIDVGSTRPKINPPEKALHPQMYLWNRAYHLGGERMKPTRDEFDEATSVIMRFIDTEPNSRRLFHALLNFRLQLGKDQEE